MTPEERMPDTGLRLRLYPHELENEIYNLQLDTLWSKRAEIMPVFVDRVQPPKRFSLAKRFFRVDFLLLNENLDIPNPDDRSAFEYSWQFDEAGFMVPDNSGNPCRSFVQKKDGSFQVNSVVKAQLMHYDDPQVLLVDRSKYQ